MIDAIAIAESSGRVVQTACLCALAVLFGIRCFVRLREDGKCRRFKELFKSVHGIIGMIAAAALVIYGGTKPQTNDLRRIVHPDLRQEPACALTQDQIGAGFALAHIGTDETYDFTAPAGATVYAPWRLRGANIDRFSFSATADLPWTIPFGTNFINGFTVYSTGVLLPKMIDEAYVARSRFSDAMPMSRDIDAQGGVFAPFRANLGIVPEMNRGMLPEDALPSEVWWTVSPSNSVVITYENALLWRNTNAPVCVQAEFFENGNFIYRYDFSRAGLWSGNGVTNILVGAFNSGHGESLDISTATNLTSLFWHRLEETDTPAGDRDGDGLSTAEEIFRTRTDPGLWDTDFDGFSDGAEVASGTNPFSRDSDNDGLVDGSDPDPITITPLNDLDGDGIPANVSTDRVREILREQKAILSMEEEKNFE